MKAVRFIEIFILTLLLVGCQTTSVKKKGGKDLLWKGPIIDAHSQVDHNTDIEKVVPLMDKGGVSMTLLSTRFQRHSKDVVTYAERHPERIVPSVKTKTKAYMKGRGRFPKIFLNELAAFKFGAMPEIILWHAAKGSKAGKATIHPSDPRVRVFIDAARENGWPLVLHFEFASAGKDRPAFMAGLEDLLSSNRDIPVALIHMAQLRIGEVRRLIEGHPNLFFITSHANPITISRSNQPWTNMFSGKYLTADWAALVVAYPERFILAFDNVFPEHWGRFYLDQVVLWRKALGKLPENVANAVAHGNAERLWKLPPAKPVGAFATGK